MKKRLSVIQQSKSGRNGLFKDNYSKKIMTVNEVITCIEKGLYIGYHIRVINGVKTPCSNPDDSKFNNLG